MASGDKLEAWSAEAGRPPATNGARWGELSDIPYYAFVDSGTSEKLRLAGWLGTNYGGGGVTVTLLLAMDTAVSGDVDIDVAFRRLNATADLDTKAFAAVNSTDGTLVPTGSARVLFEVTVAFTDGADMDSVAAGEHFEIEITRDVADTASGDMWLIAAKIEET